MQVQIRRSGNVGTKDERVISKQIKKISLPIYDMCMTNRDNTAQIVVLKVFVPFSTTS